MNRLRTLRSIVSSGHTQVQSQQRTKYYSMSLIYLWHCCLGTGSLICGLFSVRYCAHFYTSGIGIWNAGVLYMIALRGLFYPLGPPGSRFLVYSHIIALFISVCILGMSSLGLHCARDHSPIERLRGYTIRRQCMDNLRRVTGYTKADIELINQPVHSMLIILSLTEILFCLHCIKKVIIDFWFNLHQSINRFYLLMCLAVITLAFGIAHTVFCSRMFYVGVGIWCPLIIWMAGIYGSRVATTRKGLLITSGVSLLSSLVIIAISIYGTICRKLYVSYLKNDVIQVGQFWKSKINASVADSDASCSTAWSRSHYAVYEGCYKRLENMGLYDSDGVHSTKNLVGHQTSFSVMLIICCSLVMLFNCLTIANNWRRRNTPVQTYLFPISV